MAKEKQNTKQDKTEKLLKTIRESAKEINGQQKEKTNRNISLRVTKEWLKENMSKTFSEKVKTVSINNESGTVSINLLNGFVLSVVGKLYNANMSYIKDNLKTVSEYMAFNRILSTEIKENAEAFLKEL